MSDDALKVLLVEPWFAGSHRQWAQGWATASRHDVAVVSLPEGSWRWRVRAGALPLANAITDHVAEHGQPDLIVVSGLVDVAQLLGHTRRVLLRETPIVIYQHESQLVYPTASGRVDNDASLRNWQSWCAADLVLFNSNFHREAVEMALPRFLENQPEDDQLPFLQPVIDRFEVMPVGLDLGWIDSIPATRQPHHPDGPAVLWPHRWEPDKDPAAFLAALRKVRDAGARVRLILAGDDPLVPSSEKAALLDEFADWVEAVGPFERSEYRCQLRRADIVVSCANHDFFGVAIAEAIAAGAQPLLPNALAYPELISEALETEAFYPPGRFGSAFVERVAAPASGPAPNERSSWARSIRERFGWATVAPRLDDRLAELAKSEP